MKTHPPAGLKWGSGASSGGPGSANAMEDFYGRSVGGRPVQRLLTVSMARRGGRTVIRVDAGAAWVYPRSPREVVPVGVREIDITGGGVSRHVDRPARVRRIVRWFDALNIVQPGQPAVSCPLILASQVKVSFRSRSGAQLARALVPSSPANGCNPIRFFIGGEGQTPLIDGTPGRGKAFVRRVERLLGVRFSSRR
jgi:hypothetical protein